MSVSAIAASGMSAAQARLQVSAHNLANLSTVGFQRQHLAQTTERPTGAGVSVVPASEPGTAASVDIVALLQAEADFMANLAVFLAGDRLKGSLLDAVA
jgi:flagellar hook-associated protein FlgK